MTTLQDWTAAFQLIAQAALYHASEASNRWAGDEEITETTELSYMELTDDSDRLAAASHIIDSLSFFTRDEIFDPITREIMTKTDSEGTPLSAYIKLARIILSDGDWEAYFDNGTLDQLMDFGFSLEMIADSDWDLDAN